MRFKAFLLGLLGVVFGEDFGASEVWEEVKGKYGSKGGIEENLRKPLEGVKEMENVSGSVRFSAKVSCPSDRDAIVVYFMPEGGNDYGLIIKQDMDMDGSYEYIYDTSSSGIRLSGVCYSGIVSCRGGGSWKGCEYYVWRASEGGYIRLEPTSDTSLLGACFCSNASCGVNTLEEEIVEYVRGGISAAIMNVRSEFQVSESEFNPDEMKLTLKLQNPEGCAYEGQAYGETDVRRLSSYYESQTLPPSLDYVLTNPSLRSENSPYTLVSRATEIEVDGRRMGVPSEISCDIRKDVSLYTTDMFEECSETFVDENGEVWCIEVKYEYDRGGSHCGGRTCRDCSKFVQGSDEWEVCGEVYYEKVCDEWECWEEPVYTCTKDICRTYVELKNSDVYEFFKVFGWALKSGNFLREDYCQTFTDEDGFSYQVCKDVYELLCRKPLTGRVKLHKEQKWALYIEISGLPGDRGRYWAFAYVNDGVWEKVYMTPPCTCNARTFFKVFGVAQEEGEEHVLGAIQEANGWGKNHQYPPRWGKVYILKSQVYKGDVVELVQSSTCPSDERCVIKNEWICDKNGENCVQTISDGVRNGNLPLPSCYEHRTQIDTYVVCAYGDRIEVRSNTGTYDRTFTGSEMWFWIKREYECPEEGIYTDFERFKAVVGSGAYQGGEITYSDFVCDGGVCREVRRESVEVQEMSCPVKTCIVRVYGQDTSVFADRTNRGQTQGGTQTSSLEVRVCNGNVCPVNEGEELVEACSCERGMESAGFGVSVSVLQSVVDASKDIICSSVSP